MKLIACGLATLCFLCPLSLNADTFGTGSHSFEIDFVTIGNPGNTSDPSDGDEVLPGVQHFGSVSEIYRIGKYEVSEDMINKANTLGGLGITSSSWGANKPSTEIDWLEALRFVNWLNTNTGNTPAYKFDSQGSFQLWSPGDPGYDSTNLYRNILAKYFLPSDDEWYKAAYFDPVKGVYYVYPTGSDTAPTSVASGTANGTAVFDRPDAYSAGPAEITQAGGLSPYGTMAQGGNVFEWLETDKDLVNDSTDPNPEEYPNEQVVRGGDAVFWVSGLSSSVRSPFYRTEVHSFFGLRVASIAIPEPATLLLAACGTLVLLGTHRV